MSWFDGLLTLLDRMPTERLTLMRDVVNALVEHRRQSETPTHDSIESALVAACSGGADSASASAN